MNDLERGQGAIWSAAGPILRIDPRTGKVTGPVPAAAGASDIGVGDGAVWATVGTDVLRIDPASLAVTARIPMPPQMLPEGIVTTPGAVWVAGHHLGAFVRIDPSTNKIIDRVPATEPGSDGLQGVTFGDGAIWATAGDATAVVRIDPKAARLTATLQFTPFMAPCGNVAVGTRSGWATACFDGTDLGRFDPATNTPVSVLDLGLKMIQPVADGNHVWVVAGADPQDPVPRRGYLLEVSDRDKVLARYDLGLGFISGGAAIYGKHLYVSDWRTPRIIRIPLADVDR